MGQAARRRFRSRRPCSSLLAPSSETCRRIRRLRVDIAPTIAPIVTGNPGPDGELTELEIAHVAVDIVEPGPETVWLSGAFDARLGMDFDFLPDGSGLSITLGQPSAADLTMSVIYNPLGAKRGAARSGAAGPHSGADPGARRCARRLPAATVLRPQPGWVEVSRTGQFMGLYANLTPTP